MESYLDTGLLTFVFVTAVFASKINFFSTEKREVQISVLDETGHITKIYQRSLTTFSFCKRSNRNTIAGI